MERRPLPGLGAVAALGGGALVALLLARRQAAPRNAARPVLGSFGAELAVRWFEDAAADGALRNAGARLTYRPVGATGERYPLWLRALRDQAGVYVIRDKKTGEPLYVGASSGRLYDTITRHLQRWTRWKSWWRGQYAESDHDPGVTYDRARVEVAARVLPADEALDEEARLIRTLKPRDNVNLVGDRADEVPF